MDQHHEAQLGTPTAPDTAPDPTVDVASVRKRIGRAVVGRGHELDLVLATVAAGRDVLLEGPPGTSKSTLLRVIAQEWGIPFVLVEGNADLTPAKLVGHHDPARVLAEGYRDENFVEGPLVRAMRVGGFLYVEEFNRAPDDTLNTLLTAMAEREIVVPRAGTVRAGDGFRVIASMNPYDTIGTTRLSTSIQDRFNRLALSYQDAGAEQEIVALRTGLTDGRHAPALGEALVQDATALTRATREHPDVRQGSSVRGAIDLALIAAQLCTLRGIRSPGQARMSSDDDDRSRYAHTVLDAALLGLSGRIHLDESVPTTPEAVIRDLWETHFVLLPAAAAPG